MRKKNARGRQNVVNDDGKEVEEEKIPNDFFKFFFLLAHV